MADPACEIMYYYRYFFLRSGVSKAHITNEHVHEMCAFIFLCWQPDRIMCLMALIKNSWIRYENQLDNGGIKIHSMGNFIFVFCSIDSDMVQNFIFSKAFSVHQTHPVFMRIRHCFRLYDWVIFVLGYHVLLVPCIISLCCKYKYVAWCWVFMSR